MKFIDFNLHQALKDGIRDLGFEEATEVQQKTIPVVLEGKDIIASSETGSGKTGAFVIPLIEMIHRNPQKGVRALILTPTRELASQIDEQVTILGFHTDVSSATVYGGTDGAEWELQKKAVGPNGAQIIIATPGRLLDHIKLKNYDFGNVDFLVLDEADRMLDMGFIPDVTKIIGTLPPKRQNILFSATIPDTLNQLFYKITENPVRVDCSKARTAEGINQFVVKVDDNQTFEVVEYLLTQSEVTSAIVFTETKREADELTRFLLRQKINVAAVHGDREQAEREAAVEAFRSGKVIALIATNVLARGIDIDDISHIFNLNVPREAEDYIHRIGRTARAKAVGTAILLVRPEERRAFQGLQSRIKMEIKELDLPEHLQSKNKESSSKPYRKSEAPTKRPSKRKPVGPKPVRPVGQDDKPYKKDAPQVKSSKSYGNKPSSKSTTPSPPTSKTGTSGAIRKSVTKKGSSIPKTSIEEQLKKLENVPDVTPNTRVGEEKKVVGFFKKLFKK